MCTARADLNENAEDKFKIKFKDYESYQDILRVPDLSTKGQYGRLKLRLCIYKAENERNLSTH